MIVKCVNVNDTLKRIKVFISSDGGGGEGFDYEPINFENAEGLFEIDFSLNSRFAKFPRPNTEAFNVIVVDEEAGKTGDVEITGYSMTINKTDDVISSITLDGIFGTGYIILTN